MPIDGAFLGFLGKAIGFVAEHTWTLIAFVAGLIGVWLMQKASRKKQVGTRLVMVAGQAFVAGACTLRLVSTMLVLCDI